MQDIALFIYKHKTRSLNKAQEYINLSLEDAYAYNNRLRRIEISSKLQMITNAYTDEIRATNIMLEHNFIFGGFTLSAGVLANKNTGLDNDFRFYPGVDMSYRPNDNCKFYASWNKALRMPTYTDLYISNVVQQGDITLNPEKNSTFKVGTQYRQTGFAATVSGFYAHGTNMIDWVQTSVTEQDDNQQENHHEENSDTCKYK